MGSVATLAPSSHTSTPVHLRAGQMVKTLDTSGKNPGHVSIQFSHDFS